MDSGSNAFQSYGKKEAYNSNVSQNAMEVYTTTLNDLLTKDNHHISVDDMTIVYFAMKSDDDAECDAFTNFFDPDKSSENKASEVNTSLKEKIFKTLMHGTTKDLSKFNIDKDVTFYIFGMTPNNSRIAQKFLCRDSFGNIINNVVQHQKDITISERIVESGKPITFKKIFKELISPNATNGKVPSPLVSAVMVAVFQGTAYPNALLENVVRRVKTDHDDDKNKYIKINDIRAGIIKGYINRNLRLKGETEEFQMSLDLENKNSAYLCGRLFAVCERIQKDALGEDLNQTIKDSYFASACSTPTVVFPNLLKLSQNHLAVIRKQPINEGFKRRNYQKLISEIVDKLDGEFPSTLSLEDQGRFIIGYYHQNKDFFTKKSSNDENTQPENN
jgi:CRISPR-associated protein Csd1